MRASPPLIEVMKTCYFFGIQCREADHAEGGCFHDEAGTRVACGVYAEAEAAHRPGSQFMRELMREFVQRQREAREYEEFLRRKVDAARSSMRPALAKMIAIAKIYMIVLK